MAKTYFYSAAEALEHVRQNQHVLADPYQLHEVFAALARGCDSRSYEAGYDAGQRAQTADDE